MRTTVRFLVRRVMLAGSFAFASIVVAQPPQNLLPQPRIASVFPVGAQVGTAVDATLIGTDLDGATQLLFSHPGLTAELPPPPPEPPADPKKKDDKKDDKKKETPKPNKKAPPPPTEAKFKIKVDAKTPPGSYDLRVVNKYGVSNPRTFVVGELPEVVEKEPNNDVTEPQKVAIGTTINGVINSATDVDYSAFVGKANQRVFVQCAASSLDSKLRPLVEVFDTAGKRLAQNRNYADTDALADVTLPKDGEYLVRLTEFAHQSGSGDHFYRLTIRSGPWIDAVHPPAIEPNKPTTVTLYGRNLPGGKLVPDMSVDGRPIEALTQTITPSAAVGELKFTRRVDPPTALQDGFEFKLAGSNSVPIYLANGSVTLEPAADNDTPEKAAAIAPPCEIAGRIDRRYDRDWYRFTAKKGDTYTIDLLADRIGSTIDAFLTIRNATTKQDIANEATLDDNSESLHPTSFFSRNTDPAAYQFVAPADGEYLVLVGSRESNVNYGPRCGYLLRIRPAKPDFRIVVMPRSRENPQAVIAQPSGETAFDVFVHRIDGFAGTVDVKVDGLPNGVTASKCLIASGAKWGTLVLSGGETLKDSEAKLIVTGSATLDGKPLTRTARSASITWGLPGQPNVPLVVRLDQQVILATRGEKATFRLKPDLAAATKKVNGKDEKTPSPFVLQPGEKLTIPVKVLWHDKDPRPNVLNLAAEATQQNMNQAPVTMNNGQPIQIPKDKSDITAVIDVRSSAPPGTYLVTLRGDTVVKYSKDPMDKTKKDITVSAFAVPFEVRVMPTSLAKLSAQAATLKLGAVGELVVKVERLAEFAGEFAVAAELPKDVTGIVVNRATIAPNTNEVKLTVTVAKDAKIGTINNVTIVAMGKYEGTLDIKHETKLNLTVSK